MKISLFVLAFNLFAVGLYSQEINSAFFDRVDNVLKDIVIDGSVKYDKLKSNSDFISLVSDIQSAELDGLDAKTKEAFYINAYNLLVINQVRENYPLSSVQEIPGFFEKKKVIISGKKMSLNSIEKDFLLNEYNDARFHFVLVCGALGCPPLINKAYLPNTLNAQLEKQTKIAINGSFLKVNTDKKRIQASQIMEWYKEDFTKNGKEIAEALKDCRRVVF